MCGYLVYVATRTCPLRFNLACRSGVSGKKSKLGSGVALAFAHSQGMLGELIHDRGHCRALAVDFCVSFLRIYIQSEQAHLQRWYDKAGVGTPERKGITRSDEAKDEVLSQGDSRVTK